MKKILEITSIIFFLALPIFGEGTREEIEPERETLVDPSLSYENVIKASELNNYTLVTTDGTQYGKVVDTVIDMDRGYVSYLLIEYTNVDQFDDEDDIELNTPYVIPLWYVQPGEGNTLIMDFDHDYLYANLPTVEEVSTGPSEENAEWDTTLLTVWSNPVTTIPVDMRERYQEIQYYQYTNDMAGDASVVTNIRFSQLQNVQVNDPNHEDIGVINELAVSLTTGEVLTAFFQPSGNLQYTNYAIPLSAFVLSSDPTGIYYDNQKVPLNKVTGFNSNWPNIEDQSWYSEMKNPWKEDMLHSTKINRGMRAVPRPIYTLEYFLGFSLLNYFDEGLGDIADYIICRGGNIRYAVIDYDQFLGLGGKNTLAPVNLMDYYPVDTVAQINITIDDLDEFPYFGDGEMPDTSTDGWDEVFRTAWNKMVEGTDDMGEAEETPVYEGDPTPAGMLASKILDYDVVNPEGEGLGEADDIMMDMITLKVAYVVLEADGLFDNTLYAVPLSSFSWDIEEERLVLDVTEEKLENAPGFEWDEDWPQAANPQWRIEADEYWME